MEAIVENPGYCPCCRSATTFRAEDPWLRDAYVCLGCGSIPRQRHLQAVLDQFFPAWEHLVLHESSPSNDFLANRCMHYSSSQYLPGVALGSHHHGVRCESIEELTFTDESIDIFVSQDVLEHVFHPERAIREVNPGYYCFRIDDLFSALARVGTGNASGEIYLTDLVGLAAGRGVVALHVPPDEVAGVNTPEQLAALAAVHAARLA
jgi:hypothetical protein